MCRLLGYVTRTPVPVSQFLGETFSAFKDLSQHHRDGWGFSWYDEQNQIQLAKTTEAAYESDQFAQLSEEITTDTFIGHLRWATPGFILCTENTHPFQFNDVAFAHNGLIEPKSALKDLIDPGYHKRIAGTTDSEHYFYGLLSALEHTSSVEEGVQAYLNALHQITQPNGANFLFMTPDKLYAMCDFDPESPRAQAEPDYYPLHYRVTSDAIVIGSTGLQEDDSWQTLENGQMLVVDRGTLQISIVDVIDNSQRVLQEQYQSVLQ